MLSRTIPRVLLKPSFLCNRQLVYFSRKQLSTIPPEEPEALPKIKFRKKKLTRFGKILVVGIWSAAIGLYLYRCNYNTAPVEEVEERIVYKVAKEDPDLHMVTNSQGGISRFLINHSDGGYVKLAVDENHHLNGESESFNAKGIKTKFTIVEGVRQGEFTSFFPENHEIKTLKSSYNNGIQRGIVSIDYKFDPNDPVSLVYEEYSATDFKKDPESIVIKYYRNGNQISGKVDENGKVNGPALVITPDEKLFSGPYFVDDTLHMDKPLQFVREIPKNSE